MNKAEQALHELGEMDALAAGTSPVHALCPLSKLLVTIIYIAFVVSFEKYALTHLVPMALFPVLVFEISGVPMRVCFRKLRFVLPLVLAVGLFNPVFDRAPYLTLGGIAVSGGVVSMLTLMLKGTLCLTASFLLMATTRIEALCAVMRRLHVPGLLVTLLLLTYRYVGVMTEEIAVMTDAYQLRAPGHRGIHYTAWGSFLGQLLLRSTDRAEEIYHSMLLRGFSDRFYYAAAQPFATADGVYLACCAVSFLLLRFVDATRLLGGLVVR